MSVDCSLQSTELCFLIPPNASIQSELQWLPSAGMFLLLFEVFPKLRKAVSPMFTSAVNENRPSLFHLEEAVRLGKEDPFTNDTTGMILHISTLKMQVKRSRLLATLATCVTIRLSVKR